MSNRSILSCTNVNYLFHLNKIINARHKKIISDIVITFQYCISSNERTRRLLNFETVRCGAY